MLSCKDASYLASKALDGSLTWRERLGLEMHLAMCSLCRRYVRNIKRLRVFLRRTTKQDSGVLPEHIQLSENARKRILDVLKDKQS